MLVIKGDNSIPTTSKITEFTKNPDSDVFHKAVGGYLELVPYFDTIHWDGELHQCVAFCDEEGKIKGKEFNITATLLWKLALERSGKWVGIESTGNFLEVRPMPDYLVGDIAVVWGDKEFMDEL
jgi:hypothetical protein